MGDELRAMVFEVAVKAETAPWGWIGLLASERGLRMLTLPARTQEAVIRRLRPDYQDASLTSEDPLLTETARQVNAYLAGELKDFSIDLDLRGHRPFELSVWTVVARIPFGQTRTYAWVAGQVGGGPGAAQAAGAAVGSNPVPLIVPCHRVIGSDGSLHGFAGGLAMKARLLALESGQGALALDSQG